MISYQISSLGKYWKYSQNCSRACQRARSAIFNCLQVPISYQISCEIWNLVKQAPYYLNTFWLELKKVRWNLGRPIPAWVGQRAGSNGKKEVLIIVTKDYTLKSHTIFLVLFLPRNRVILLLHRLALHIGKFKAHFSYHSPIVGLSWVHQVICVITKSCVASLIWKYERQIPHSMLGWHYFQWNLTFAIFECEDERWKCEKCVVLNTFGFGTSWARMRPTREHHGPPLSAFKVVKDGIIFF
jgi:hypothetical protein